MPGPTPPASTSPSSSSDRHQKLACQECRRRKVRCDRSFPCRRCRAGGVHCTQALRKKREPGTVDAIVQSRIAKLESLVARLQDAPEAQPEDPEDVIKSQQTLGTRMSGDAHVTTTYVAAPFWSTLSDEIQALKEEIEDDDWESDDEKPANSTGFEVIMCSSDSFDVRPGTVAELSHEVCVDLCEVYIAQIEPLVKHFHVPTLRRLIHAGQPYLGRDGDAPCNQFLIASLCFHSVSMSTDAEVEYRYGQTRMALLRQTRLLADLALIKTDAMITEDLATVQALVTYIGALRYVDSSRRSWMMASLLVRLAKALYLHQEYPSESDSLFMIEMKRRAWHSVCLVDSYFALDRGSEPLIRALELSPFATPLPRNIDDCDFDETTRHDTKFDEDRWTEMSYALMTFETPWAIQKLCSSEEPGETSDQRIDVVEKLAALMERKYTRFCDPEQPIQRLCIGIARSVRHNMTLRAIRPFHRRSSAPPRVDNEWVLRLATDALRSAIEVVEDPIVARLRRLPWVPWHAIAVTYASLCFVHSTDLTVQAWDAVNKAVAAYEGTIADTKRGMLWKPIARLRVLAEAFKRQQDKAQEALLKPTIPSATTQLSSTDPAGPQDPLTGAGVQWGPGPFDVDMTNTYQLADPNTWIWDEAFSGFEATTLYNDPSLMPFMFE